MSLWKKKETFGIEFIVFEGPFIALLFRINYIRLIWKIIAFRNLDIYGRNFLISWQNVRENLIPYTKDFEISLVALFISINLQIYGTSSNLRNILYFSLKLLS